MLLVRRRGIEYRLAVYSLNILLTHIIQAKGTAVIEKESLEVIKKNVTKTGHTKYKAILDHLVTGYNCETPTDITSHEFDTLDSCENLATKKETRQVELQIFQESERFVNKGIVCTLRRTRKISHCGSSHHAVPYYEQEYTLKPIHITRKQCETWYKRKGYYFGNKEWRLELNKENIYEYYAQGTQ